MQCLSLVFHLKVKVTVGRLPCQHLINILTGNVVYSSTLLYFTANCIVFRIVVENRISYTSFQQMIIGKLPYLHKAIIIIKQNDK